MSDDEFAKNGGVLCPVCRSNDVNQIDSDYHLDLHFEYMVCLECGIHYTAEYTLDGYTIDYENIDESDGWEDNQGFDLR